MAKFDNRFQCTILSADSSKRQPIIGTRNGLGHSGQSLGLLRSTYLGFPLMDMFAICYQSFAVLSIYYFWNAYVQARLQRERTLRERITYMLWVMADRVV